MPSHIENLEDIQSAYLLQILYPDDELSYVHVFSGMFQRPYHELTTFLAGETNVPESI